MLIFRAACLAGGLTLAAGFATAQSLPRSCPEAGEHDAFDFWAGVWEVYRYADQDKVAGHNTISESENNCLLLEEWQSLQGGSGSSINWYNPVTDEWRQLWVSPGVEIDISGGLDSAGVMRLEGEITYLHSGDIHPFRGAWKLLEPGRVRQTFHQYVPESGEWTVWFDGLYVRTED